MTQSDLTKCDRWEFVIFTKKHSDIHEKHSDLFDLHGMKLTLHVWPSRKRFRASFTMISFCFLMPSETVSRVNTNIYYNNCNVFIVNNMLYLLYINIVNVTLFWSAVYHFCFLLRGGNKKSNYLCLECDRIWHNKATSLIFFLLWPIIMMWVWMTH